ncbi:N-acetyl-gamma-glutamyl-phosphate reductase [Pontibacillus halophilus JSM 076056 = DSM 19796]|uniref:N-acetyl-gamma-glutamyl-phosphate reductase n=1 Tax=Pontibacillus halophilus JSM 076056 = DSM 19796 TaxID=1385510 RepID=A0A0A5GK32_9BACI|nr:N-acetyl-gamma-glutamyl-phosphate reductase [Pontibacillus halophilus]KGX92369.1 N-acetyl-gamma-glutamyl-phosphate reductase [Pontibacillus halophilus JSM 076056 = DSM 19796]
MKVGILGGSGYGGLELIRLLLMHPYVEIEKVVSPSYAGQELSSVFPHLNQVELPSFVELDALEVAEGVDLIFFATPADVSATYIPTFHGLGVPCIDLSGGFRLRDGAVFEEWYNHASPSSELLREAVYGLTELNPEQIEHANIIANPGCYPTATLLGLLPIMKEKWLSRNSIIIDGKSGVSGAGRKVGLGTHFAEVNENISAYKVNEHQHIPEIEQVLSELVKKETRVSFTTHLIPLTRGMMCTLYVGMKESHSTAEIIALYEAYYENHPFVRIFSEGTFPTPKGVAGTNYCDIGLSVDHRTKRITIVSCIDNLMKGAAGQAVQNMNVRFGFPEKTGLVLTPVFP